jgi:polyphenol oxidase
MIELALPGARVLFTDRTVDLRASPGHFGPVRFGRQVHGGRVLRDASAVQEADGQIVTDRAHGAMVMTADCLPVALAAPGAAGMLHGGWRGLAAGIVAAGVGMLEGPVSAALGPSARGCCYEVGEEVHAVFAEYDARVGERNLALERVAAAQLRAAGVAEVHDTGICTICDRRFFSYRREGAAAGRQGGIAWRA